MYHTSGDALGNVYDSVQNVYPDQQASQKPADKDPLFSPMLLKNAKAF